MARLQAYWEKAASGRASVIRLVDCAREKAFRPLARLFTGAHGRFVKFFILAGVAALAVLVVYLAWSYDMKGEENERRALAEARTLSAEIGAAWEYVDSVQPVLKRLSGDPLSGGVYCVIAAKDIAERFSDDSEYSIRYVRIDPRNKDDEPDEFEREAFEEFEETDAAEYYGIVREDAGIRFRYVAKLEIDEGCLACHGEPAGEMDASGYPKEGMQVGDMGGAVSVVMPMDQIFDDARNDLLRTVVFFCVLMGVVGVFLAVALRTLVARPVIEETDRLIRRSKKQSRIISIAIQELKSRPSDSFRSGDLTVNLRTGDALLRGRKVDLTPKESRIVALLAEHPDEAVSKDEIIRRIWGEEFLGTSISVSSYIRRIRSKIEDDPDNPRYLQTVRGKGYCLRS